MASNALNPSVVKTELDRVFYQEWDMEGQPGYGDVRTPYLFNQMTSDKAVEQVSVFTGTGYFDETGENENLPAANSLVQDKVNYTHVKFARAENISKEFFDDDQHATIAKIVRSLAMRGKQTQNKEGFGVYRNAFNASFPGGDGVSLCSDSHPTSTGTADNKLTAKLTTDSLNAAIVLMQTMKDKDGVTMGHTPDTLLVHSSNFKRACEIVDSELLADTADNNINVYSSKYGIMVFQTPFIGTSEGGSDDYWFLIDSNYFSINRYVRREVTTYMRDYIYSDNEQYRYSASYRESVGFDNYAGVVGSDGTTGSYA